MRLAVLASACWLFAASMCPAWGQPGSVGQGSAGLITAAVTALGGEQAMRGLNSLLIEGNAKHWEPEESFVAGAAPRFLGDSSFTLSWQLALGWARFDWIRSMQ